MREESLTGVNGALDTLSKKTSFLSTSAAGLIFLVRRGPLGILVAKEVQDFGMSEASATAAKNEAMELVKKLQQKHSNLLMLGWDSGFCYTSIKPWDLLCVYCLRMGAMTKRQRKLMLAMTSKRLAVDDGMEGPVTGLLWVSSSAAQDSEHPKV